MTKVHVIGALCIALTAAGCGKDKEHKKTSVRPLETVSEHETETADPEVTVSIISAPSAALDQGATFQFVASVRGTADSGVHWSTVGGGSINASGLFVAPAGAGEVTVVATSKEFADEKDEVKVTVKAVTVAASGPGVVFVDETGQYSATVAGTVLGNGIEWSVTGDGDVGSIDANGLFTPNAARGEYTATIVATSAASPAQSDSINVTVALRPIISISGSASNLLTGGMASFAASVSDGTPGVTWSVLEGAAGGSIDAAGNYTAPAAGGTFHVVATHAQYPSASAQFTVVVCSAFDTLMTYWNPGTQATTDDDVITSRVRFGAGELAAFSSYQDVNAAWLEVAADDVLKSVTYSGPGADNAWLTSDDDVAAYFVLIADASGTQTGYARLGTAGVDGVMGTADDEVLEMGAINRDAAGFVNEVTRYTSPGADLVWGTSDDGKGGFTTFAYDVDGFLVKSYTLNGARNIQGIRAYVNDASGRPATVTVYTHPGTGNVWEDGNDRYNRIFTYAYDGSGRLSDRTEQVFNGPSNTPQPQNDKHVIYTYGDAGSVPAEMTQYGSGADNLIGNADDAVGAFAQREMMCPW